VFNANAAKLYKVHMDVDYISEARRRATATSLPTIDQYTHQDRYDYILEIDTAGRSSAASGSARRRTAAPGLRVVPIRASATTVAGGKISYAERQDHLRPVDAGRHHPAPAARSRRFDAADTVVKSAWKQYGPFDVAAGTTLTAVMTGDGDADLYVRRKQRDATAYDCRPYRDGTSEQCSIIGPAKVYVGVNGYARPAHSPQGHVHRGGGVTPPRRRRPDGPPQPERQRRAG